jgi:ADP-ribose pyrophosphatase YjhB (NUDIX family)
MNRRVAVRAIILQENTLLCVRQKHYAGGILTEEAEWWCLPGGGLDEGEAIMTGLEREIIEELGVKPEIGKLLYVQQFMHDGQEHLEFFFEVTNPADFAQLDLTTTTHGLAEIAEYGFIDPKNHNVLPKLLKAEDLATQAAKGSTKFFDYF